MPSGSSGRSLGIFALVGLLAGCSTVDDASSSNESNFNSGSALQALHSKTVSVEVHSAGKSQTFGVNSTQIAAVFDWQQVPVNADDLPPLAFCVPEDGGTGIRFLDQTGKAVAAAELGCTRPAADNIVRIAFASNNSAAAIGAHLRGAKAAELVGAAPSTSDGSGDSSGASSSEDAAEVAEAKANLRALRSDAASVTVFSGDASKSFAVSAPQIAEVLDWEQTPHVGAQVPPLAFCVPIEGDSGMIFMNAAQKPIASFKLGCTAPTANNVVRIDFAPADSKPALGLQINGAKLAAAAGN